MRWKSPDTIKVRLLLFTLLLFTLLAILPVLQEADAQTHGLASETVRILEADSQVLRHNGPESAEIWSTTIRVRDAAWIRLRFETAILGQDPMTGESSELLITSLEDGAFQILDATSIKQWHNTSAYFNGHAITVALHALPNNRVNHIVIQEVIRDAPDSAGDGWNTICDSTDDRLPSSDPRSGRALPIGCTAWIFNDANRCLLTAGHCLSGSVDVVEFNCPLSDSSGNIVHPPPEDQYAADNSSKQYVYGGQGNDWGYFGCFPNSTTGLTPFEAQGGYFVLTPPPAVSGQDIRITGFGTMSSPPEWNQAQKTHAGPYWDFSGTTLQYRTDTTGGNSGSPVINEDTGEAIGIHTHGGCSSSGGANVGTGSNNAGFLAALDNPQGVCAAGLAFAFPDDLPLVIDPTTGAVVRVEVTGVGATLPASGTGLLHYDLGSGPVTVPMTEVFANIYDAVIPPVPFGQSIDFYFSAESTTSGLFTDPKHAPADQHFALGGKGLLKLIDDDFEQDLGWTVENTDLDAGAWERGDPLGGGDRGDPPDDFDGSGKCYLTENVDGDSDVDGGPTILVSPVLDLSSGESVLHYARWHSSDDDLLYVEISDNGGSTWARVESAASTDAWVSRTYRISDLMTPTDQMRFRFRVADNPNGSVTESGVDSFTLFAAHNHALIADAETLSASTGGTINLALDGGTGNHGRAYLILGTKSGSNPGTPLPNGGETVPVNWDSFTDFILNHLNEAIFVDFFSVLDNQGRASARIVAPPVGPGNIGQVMTYAFLLEGNPDWDFVSNAVDIVFIP